MKEELKQILLQIGNFFIWQGEQLSCSAEVNNQVWAWFNTAASSMKKSCLYLSKWNYLLIYYHF